MIGNNVSVTLGREDLSALLGACEFELLHYAGREVDAGDSIDGIIKAARTQTDGTEREYELKQLIVAYEQVLKAQCTLSEQTLREMVKASMD